MPSVQSFPSSLFLPSVNAPRIYLTLSLDQEKTSTILPTIASTMVMPSVISLINIQTAFPSKSCAKFHFYHHLGQRLRSEHCSFQSFAWSPALHHHHTRHTPKNRTSPGSVDWGGFAIDTVDTQPLNAFTFEKVIAKKSYDTCKRSTVSRAVGAESQTRPFWPTQSS